MQLLAFQPFQLKIAASSKTANQRRTTSAILVPRSARIVATKRQVVQDEFTFAAINRNACRLLTTPPQRVTPCRTPELPRQLFRRRESRFKIFSGNISATKPSPHRREGSNYRQFSLRFGIVGSNGVISAVCGALPLKVSTLPSTAIATLSLIHI